jgi:type II secretion system protein N
LKFNLQISKKSIPYAAYIVGITLLFLYVLFPSDALKMYLADQLRRGNPNINVSINRIRPALPPGITLKRVDVSLRNTALIGLDDLKLVPAISSLFSNNTRLKFKGSAYEGKLSGTAVFNNDTQERQAKIDGQISGIQIQEISALQGLTIHDLSGKLGGNFAFTENGPNQSLTGKLAVSECRVEFAAPVMNQQSLTFSAIDADLALKNRKLIITRCDLKGNQLDANITGSIALNGSNAGNALNLKGTMTPHHVLLTKIKNSLSTDFLRRKQAGKTVISFKISGTLEEPGFLLN